MGRTRADISMPRQYVPAYTRKLALNSSDEPRVDEGPGVISVPASFLTRFGGNTKPSAAQTTVKEEPADQVTEMPGKASEAYLRRISNAKRALVAQQRLSAGYKRGLPRFLAVGQDDYKPQIDSPPRSSPPSDLQPRAGSRWARGAPLRQLRGLREISCPELPQFGTGAPGKTHWSIVCISLIVAIFLVGMACQAGIREAIYDILWHAQMKQLGLHPPYYLVEKTANYL
ncbi:hypothetical protein B9G98_02806 [Wickerhamiella sorbophila]|uniref:Uncharacterized protein n=1 Tax=Wickerhamiella sorbophila TaxID=45607 RepID=A0A2T0FJM4_9ASCO|nr:hypothetical protein B9G98_02806 [Wickerhamiella sorbophila]PRT55186.1 hypothetical protein B9G98_02806 [Wickerhamiella sorbophila]